MRKKILSALLAVTMLVTLAAPVFAEEDTGSYDHLVVPISEEADANVLVDGQTVTVQGGVPNASMEGYIVLLHSNDVHGAIDGYAKMAGLKEMYTLLGADVLVLDAGDFVQGTTAVSTSQGQSAVELMNLVGYDAAVPGNHEFDYGYDNLKKLEEQADFPFLAANVTKDGQSAFDGSAQFRMEKSGKTVAVFGLTTPETASKAHPAKIAGVKFDGGEAMCRIAQAEATTLKATGADYVVCLGHLGIDEETAATANRSVDLLEKVSGIDVFIDGHSHSTMADLAEKVGEQRTVNGAVIASTGTKFAGIGAVEIAPDGTITSQCWDTESMSVASADVAAKAAAIQAEIDTLYGAKFARTEVTLDGSKAPGVRTQETNLGDLIADSMRWYATRDGALEVPAENVVAITNGGGIRASIEAGDITRKDINTVLPFGNTVTVVYVPGSVLLEVLEASTYCTPEAVGAFPQVSGIDFTVDITKDYDQGAVYGDTTYFAPASIRRVAVRSVNGAPFDRNATYAVVTNDFLAAGGDTYYALSTAGTIVDTGTPLDEALMAYITEELGGVVTAEAYGSPKGRVSQIEAAAPKWYDDTVAAVTERGLMTGTGNGFEPEATVTRATVFQTLYNLEGRPVTSADTVFTDTMGTWYEPAAIWAHGVGLALGTGAGAFEGNRPASREEIVTILYRYALAKSVDVSVGENTNILPYEDAENVAPWAVPAFRWAVGAKVVSGQDGVRLAPTSQAMRCELAQILVNFTDSFPQPAQ